MSGTVSVVIPTFNRADLVCRAIDSALSQTYPDIEVVVIDDGSKDNTSEVVETRYGQEPRVRYIRVDNGGVSKARNIGIRESRGAYVAFLDSDDYWLPWKAELQVKCLARVPEAGMIWTNMTAVSDDGTFRKPDYLRKMYTTYARLAAESVPLFGSPRKVAAAELMVSGFSADVEIFCGNIFSQMVLGNLVHTSTCLLRRERLAQVVGFREDLKVTGEDYDFHLRTCREGAVAFVDVESIGYTVGRSDQLTAPGLSAQLARNALKTIEPVLAESGHLIHLPKGAVRRMLASTHAWAADSSLRAGRNAEARAHAWASIWRDPTRRQVYLIFLAALLPKGLLTGLRGGFRSVKTALRS